MIHAYFSRRAVLAALAAAPLVAGHALAHHGWAWTQDETFELSGTIVEGRWIGYL